MDQVDPYALNINIRINIIRINLMDQLDLYDLQIILTHTHHKCEESVGTILTFSKNVGCTNNMLGAPNNTLRFF
ncbi:hypothetical protein GmHk_20G056660 [Glycine max]|nr:hypothetical protein GmHk_20G056660 [Glycine max]